MKSSGNKADGAVVVKKSAYPFPVTIQLEGGGGTPIACRALRLTPAAMLVDMAPTIFLRASDRYDVAFALPGSGASVKAHATVVKFYDQYAGASAKLHMAELQFRALEGDGPARIAEFLRSIRSKAS